MYREIPLQADEFIPVLIHATWFTFFLGMIDSGAGIIPGHVEDGRMTHLAPYVPGSGTLRLWFEGSHERVDCSQEEACQRHLQDFRHTGQKRSSPISNPSEHVGGRIPARVHPEPERSFGKGL